MQSPYILFNHVIDRVGHRDALYGVARNQAQDLSGSLKAICDRILNMLEEAKVIGLQFETNEIVRMVLKDRSLARALVAGFSDQDKEQIDDLMLKAIISTCPAVGTLVSTIEAYIHTLVDSYISRVTAGKKIEAVGKPSDLGDFTHCMFAPYFDVYRCDASFGALLKKHAPIRNQIAQRRSDILRMIDSDIALAN
jgi:hypothetical protein